MLLVGAPGTMTELTLLGPGQDMCLAQVHGAAGGAHQVHLPCLQAEEAVGSVRQPRRCQALGPPCSLSRVGLP